MKKKSKITQRLKKPKKLSLLILKEKNPVNDPNVRKAL